MKTKMNSNEDRYIMNIILILNVYCEFTVIDTVTIVN